MLFCYSVLLCGLPIRILLFGILRMWSPIKIPQVPLTAQRMKEYIKTFPPLYKPLVLSCNFAADASNASDGTNIGIANNFGQQSRQ